MTKPKPPEGPALTRLCREEPEWAANRIEVMRGDIVRLSKELEAAEARVRELERAIESWKREEGLWIESQEADRALIRELLREALPFVHSQWVSLADHQAKGLSARIRAELDGSPEPKPMPEARTLLVEARDDLEFWVGAGFVNECQRTDTCELIARIDDQLRAWAERAEEEE